MRAFFTNTVNAFFRTPIAVDPLTGLRDSVEKLTETQGALKAQQKRLLQLQRELADYCAQTQQNIDALQLKKTAYPGSVKIQQHLEFYLAERNASEQRLLEINQELQRIEQKTQALKEEFPVLFTHKA